MSANKYIYEDYREFLKTVGYGKIDDGVAVTNDGFPLSAKEAKFIDLFLVYGEMKRALEESGLSWKQARGKKYITDEISYRLAELKKKTIADADEIMQYFTKVMRGEEKDQFGLDAPLSERSSAARELAKRIVDTQDANVVPEIKVTLNWD